MNILSDIMENEAFLRSDTKVANCGVEGLVRNTPNVRRTRTTRMAEAIQDFQAYRVEKHVVSFIANDDGSGKENRKVRKQQSDC